MARVSGTPGKASITSRFLLIPESCWGGREETVTLQRWASMAELMSTPTTPTLVPPCQERMGQKGLLWTQKMAS